MGLDDNVHDKCLDAYGKGVGENNKDVRFIFFFEKKFPINKKNVFYKNRIDDFGNANIFDMSIDYARNLDLSGLQ